MKKILGVLSAALLGAVLGLACGGAGKTPATESTIPAAEEDEAAPAGGEAYGGAAYGGEAGGESGAGGSDVDGW